MISHGQIAFQIATNSKGIAMRFIVPSLVIIFVILLTGCTSITTAAVTSSSAQAKETSQSSVETTSSDIQSIEVEENLFDVKITFPASITIGEGVNEVSIESEAKKQGIHEVIFNEDKTITYVMDKSTHKKLLTDMKARIDESIDKLISGENEVESFSKIEYNIDLTEFTVLVDEQKYNEMDSVSAIPFYIMGGFYQVFNGVDSEKTNVTVKFIDKDTGAVLNTANSAEAMNSKWNYSQLTAIENQIKCSE
jgi:hypothetical protein